MALVDVFINVVAEPRIAVPLAQEIVSLIEAKVARAGHTLRKNKIRFLCERCEEPMVLREKTLACDSCLGDEAEQQMIQRIVEQDFRHSMLTAERL